MFARSPVSERSFRFRTSAACITVTNVRPRNAMPADAFLANDKRKIVTVPDYRTHALFFLRFQLNDVMNFISPFTSRLEPGQNYPDHAIFDFDQITDFELRFVRSASKSLALWF